MLLIDGHSSTAAAALVSGSIDPPDRQDLWGARYTVRHWLRTGTLPPDQRGCWGAGKIDPYVPYLQRRLAEGCTNQSRLWREIREQGLTGTRSLVAKWINAHGLARTGTPQATPLVFPSARQLA
jgi:hypothetical protein